MRTLNNNRMATSPLRTPRTLRNHQLSVLTSLPAGKIVPIAAIPMLREDALSGRARVAVEMQETAEILMNGTDLRVMAHLVPFLAFERFQGSRDQFDRSYMGQAKDEDEGATVTPFIETETVADGAETKEILKYLGIHFKAGSTVNVGYIEAYNVLVNFMRKNRSKGIAQRTRLDASLAEAFWNHTQWPHVVPDFDQAVIDGEVALNLIEQRIPIRGFGIGANGGSPKVGANVYEYAPPGSGTGQVTYARSFIGTDSGDPIPGGHARMHVEVDPTTLLPQIFAELQEGGVTVSLSNLEMARKTQAFAKLRERFEGHDDEFIIDMLMNGLQVPDQFLKQPILLADRITRFSQAKRYATDSGNLAESAVSGGAVLDVSFRVPRLSTGGVVMLTAQAVPQQLFERQQDWYTFSKNVDAWPEYMRDELDPEKVDVVTMGQIDTDHDTPDATFGYEPLNGKYNRAGAKVGGKFFRPTVTSGTDTDRQRIWAVETENPTLAEDFYIVKAIHNKPFLDMESDPFEATVAGNAVLEGNTVFGGVLVEATNNYEIVAGKAPTDRIEKPSEE